MTWMSPTPTWTQEWGPRGGRRRVEMAIGRSRQEGCRSGGAGSWDRRIPRRMSYTFPMGHNTKVGLCFAKETYCTLYICVCGCVGGGCTEAGPFMESCALSGHEFMLPTCASYCLTVLFKCLTGRIYC